MGLGSLFTDLFLYPIGWLYLKIRYKSDALIKKKLAEDYNNKYAMAGANVFLKLFGTFFLTAIGLLILATLFSVAKEIF